MKQTTFSTQSGNGGTIVIESGVLRCQFEDFTQFVHCQAVITSCSEAEKVVLLVSIN